MLSVSSEEERATGTTEHRWTLTRVVRKNTGQDAREVQSHAEPQDGLFRGVCRVDRVHTKVRSPIDPTQEGDGRLWGWVAIDEGGSSP